MSYTFIKGVILMSVKQLNHQEFKSNQKTFKNNIILILENLEHEENIGSAFRLADAFNVDSIFIVNNKQISFDKIKKTARSCEKSVNYTILESTDEALSAVKAKGYTPIALEITNNSKPLRAKNFASQKGIALIVGNEKHGVEEKTLNTVQNAVHIDMFGNNSSMNVITALSIAVYKISEDYYSKSLREDLKNDTIF